MSDFLIRLASQEDIPAIQQVRRAVRENILSDPTLVTDSICAEYLTRRGRGWVCLVAGKVQGFAILDLEQNSVWALFVHPDFEKKGIGRALQQTMLDWYFACGHTSIYLSTDPYTRAESFYRQSAWQAVGVLPNGEIQFVMPLKVWQNA